MDDGRHTRKPAVRFRYGRCQVQRDTRIRRQGQQVQTCRIAPGRNDLDTGPSQVADQRSAQKTACTRDKNPCHASDVQDQAAKLHARRCPQDHDAVAGPDPPGLPCKVKREGDRGRDLVSILRGDVDNLIGRS